MKNTFTIQSVHGLTQTFVVGPSGTVKSSQTDETKREQPADSERERKDDADRK